MLDELGSEMVVDLEKKCGEVCVDWPCPLHQFQDMQRKEIHCDKSVHG